MILGSFFTGRGVLVLVRADVDIITQIMNLQQRESPVISRLFDLSGRVALVTGGSKGLGKAMARGLAEAGADIVISSRHDNELKTAAGEIGAGLKVRVKHVVADLARREESPRLAAECLALMGKVDILINNAGTNKPQPIDEIDDARWDELLELNLSSCMALSRALAPGMKERKWGRVIHISSIMGHSSAAGRNAYSATKTALLGLARASANDLGPFGITVNCIAPGPFLTDLPVSLLSQEQRDEFARRTALGRWGQPEELIGPALLFASEAGSYITGTCLTVDGGCLARIF
jgi:NAD(P)-dependent dehydrogenase (short-subunit alcohol dehydrogenase family)